MKPKDTNHWNFTKGFYINDEWIPSSASKQLSFKLKPFGDPFKQVIFNDNIDKKERPSIYLQEWINEPTKNKNDFDKSLENIKKTNWIFIDIDFKTRNVKDKFIEDYRNGQFLTFIEAFNDFYEKLKSYEKAYISGLSASKSGFRIITYIDYDLKEADQGKTDLVKFIHSKIVKFFIKQLNEDFGLKFYRNNDIDYIDKASFNATQPTFSLSEGSINENFECLDYSDGDLKDEFINDNQINQKIQNFTKQLNVSNKKINELKDYEVEKFFSNFNHYYDNISKLFTYTHIPKNQRKIAFDKIKKSYKGKRLRNLLSNFNKFDDWILNNIKGENYYDFEDTSIENLNDTFGYEYGQNIRYSEYIGESFSQISDILNSDSVSNVVLKAPAGAGKTTFFVEYCEKYLNNDEIIVFLAPTNAILEQTYTKLRNSTQNFNVLKNYNSQYDRRDIDGKTVILSSYKAINKLNNINIKKIFVDEAHNMVNQSGFDFDFRMLENKKNIVFISATPETLMNVIGDDVYYVNFFNQKEKKKLIYSISNIDVKEAF
ncbi:MAG: DEAD/DEAH box helicase family protein, partial [bacterium]